MRNRIEINSVFEGTYSTSEAFKTLRTNLQFSGSDLKCIVVTSCLENEGKSLISGELAKTLSEIGKKVMIIDTDMRKSVMAMRYKVMETPLLGLSQYLTNQSDIQDVILETQYENLHMILAGKHPPNPLELLYTERFNLLLNKCREEYDYVIIDTAPLYMVTDAAVIAQKCDGAVIVISAGKVKYRIASNVKKQFKKAGCPILGAILNHIDGRGFSGAIGKYAHYHKHYDYKSYYGVSNRKQKKKKSKKNG